ncbi:hypothetical protein BOSEA31B_13386 [Hyphomicrobiales bacterium]|nr:hypothetical protein BOSEA31B_13386 [Hyphomicrobiales bacterium]
MRFRRMLDDLRRRAKVRPIASGGAGVRPRASAGRSMAGAMLSIIPLTSLLFSYLNALNCCSKYMPV